MKRTELQREQQRYWMRIGRISSLMAQVTQLERELVLPYSSARRIQQMLEEAHCINEARYEAIRVHYYETHPEMKARRRDNNAPK